MKRHMAWMAMILVTTLVITGCGKSTGKPSSDPPVTQPAPGEQPSAGTPGGATPGTGAGKPPASQPVTAVAITAASAPAALREWVSTQGTAEKPAYHSVAEGDATYLAITGGLQPTGGYTVEVTEISPAGDGWQVKAKVSPPVKGSVVTGALTNPVGYFKLPKLTGTIAVSVTAPPGPSAGPVTAPAGPPLTVGVRWAEPGRLEITGTASQPDLSFVLNAGGTTLGQADVQVMNGRFIGNILTTPPKSTPELTLSVRTPGPGGGKEIARIPVDAATAPDEIASPNFRVKSARRTAADTVTVEGRARAFEAVFRVEIMAGGKVLAQVPVQADAGAPAYGQFKAAIKVPGGVPDGAEAWFLTVSAKDGSTTPELSVPVTAP